MIVKMLTHMHKVVITCWCWHICEGDGVWAVERGLGSSLPPAEQAHRDLGVFKEMNWLFSFTPKAGRSGEVTEVVVVVLQATDAGHGGDRHWPCVCRFTIGAISRGGGDGHATLTRTLSVWRPGERVSVRHYAASITAKRGAGAFWTASVTR
jgi:hypothetical protein